MYVIDLDGKHSAIKVFIKGEMPQLPVNTDQF